MSFIGVSNKYLLNKGFCFFEGMGGTKFSIINTQVYKINEKV